MKALALFKALADSTRVRVVALLRDQELSVNDITAILGMGQSRVSRHLKILTDCGLLSNRKAGLFSYYATGSAYSAAVKQILQGEMASQSLYQKDQDALALYVQRQKEKTREFFNDAASHWDDFYSQSVSVFSPLIDAELPADSLCADLGCAAGDLIAELAESAGRRFIGVDHAAKMLAMAKKRLAPLSSRVELRIGDIEHLPLGDGEVPFLLMRLVLHHLPTPLAFFPEARRVLSGGGKLLICELLEHKNEAFLKQQGDTWSGFSEEQLLTWAGSNGFAASKPQYVSFKSKTRPGAIKGIFLVLTKTGFTKSKQPGASAARRKRK